MGSGSGAVASGSDRSYARRATRGQRSPFDCPLSFQFLNRGCLHAPERALEPFTLVTVESFFHEVRVVQREEGDRFSGIDWDVDALARLPDWRDA